MASDRDFKERPKTGEEDVVILVIEDKLKVTKTEMDPGGVKVTPRVKEQAAADTEPIQGELPREARALDLETRQATPGISSRPAGDREGYDSYSGDYQQVPGDLALLEELEDFRIASGETDPRGWDLVDTHGRRVGLVKNLLASPSAQQVYFALVDGGAELDNRMLAIPLASLIIHEEERTVEAPYDYQEFLNAPPFERQSRDFLQYSAYWQRLDLEPQP